MRVDSSQTFLRCALILCAAVLPWTAWGEEGDPGKIIATRLAEISRNADRLSWMRGKALLSSIGREPDIRGRTLKQDLEQHVLTDGVRAAVRQHRKEIPRLLKTGDLTAAAGSLRAFNDLVNDQIVVFNGITSYWIFEPLRSAASEDDAAETSFGGTPIAEAAPVNALRARRDAEIASGEFIHAIRTTVPELRTARNAYGEAQYRALIAELASGAYKPIREIEPRANCEPASEASDLPVPRFARNVPRGEEYLPAKVPRGKHAVGVTVLVDTKGCLRRLFVNTSSGFEHLDGAALELARDARYLPGAREGVPIEGLINFRVTFEK